MCRRRTYLSGQLARSEPLEAQTIHHPSSKLCRRRKWPAEMRRVNHSWGAHSFRERLPLATRKLEQLVPLARGTHSRAAASTRSVRERIQLRQVAASHRLARFGGRMRLAWRNSGHDCQWQRARDSANLLGRCSNCVNELPLGIRSGCFGRVASSLQISMLGGDTEQLAGLILKRMRAGGSQINSNQPVYLFACVSPEAVAVAAPSPSPLCVILALASCSLRGGGIGGFRFELSPIIEPPFILIPFGSFHHDLIQRDHHHHHDRHEQRPGRGGLLPLLPRVVQINSQTVSARTHKLPAANDEAGSQEDKAREALFSASPFGSAAMALGANKDDDDDNSTHDYSPTARP